MPGRRRSSTSNRSILEPHRTRQPNKGDHMDPVDTILFGGTIVTLDDESTEATALAIHDGKVAAVGPSDVMLRSATSATRLVDLDGMTVVPGFVDGHPHMDREGLKSRGGVDLRGLRSIAEVCEAIRQAAAATPPGEWVVAMPLGEPLDYINRPEQMVDGRFPDRRDLDAVAPEHPVYIRSIWGWWGKRPFVSIANSKAMELAGIKADTPDPYQIEIVRDGFGEPTGVFLEWNYQITIEYNLFSVVPPFDYKDRVESVRIGSTAYAGLGTTSLYEGHGLTPTLLRAYRQAERNGHLRNRFRTSLSVPTSQLDDEDVFELLYHYSGFASDRGLGTGFLTVEGISLDVADPSAASAINEGYPYEHWAGHFTQALSPERLVQIGIEAARLGLRVNCLVCYELEAVLRAYEEIDRHVPISGRRWVLTHLISATDSQLDRIRNLDLIVTVGPMFMYMADDRFDLHKLREAGMPIRQWIDAGVSIAMETDNVPPSLLWAMWESLARWDEGSKQSLGSSRLGREEALRLICQGGHALTWDEDRLGSLEAGKVADLVVLDGNPLTCALDDIRELGVELTLVDGETAYDSGALDSGEY